MMSSSNTPSYTGYRFPAEVISYAVWLYFRFPLSLRMVEEMLALRGIVVSHETVRQWGLGPKGNAAGGYFGREIASRIRDRRLERGDKWHMAACCIKKEEAKEALFPAVDRVTRTEFGRPRSSIRLRTWAAMATSVARAWSLWKRTPSPMTCFHRPNWPSTPAL
jgi:transposase-like protein